MLVQHLSLIHILGWHISTPVFDGATQEDVEELLEQAGMSKDGKTTLYDGRTGDPFASPITVGVIDVYKRQYMRNARANNAGWRIDYFIVSKDMKDKLEDAKIYQEIYGSDHCPVGLLIK